MPKPLRLLLPLTIVGMLALPGLATAGHTGDPRTDNLVPLGHIVEPATLGGFGGANPDINTDIAFWGRYAVQGNWDGFNIRDVSNPANPTTVSRTFCEGNQGDVVVWRNVLVRSWDSPAGTPGPFGSGLTCDGQAVPARFEGIHVFDISNVANPTLVAAVPTPCGSHTVTGVPDPANNRLLIYNSASSGACPQFDILSIPLGAPQTASLVRSEPALEQCHDIGVILGEAMLAACAGGTGARVFSLGGVRGGSLEDPALLYAIAEPTVTVGHSAAFSWNGEILIFGWEPGGGVAAECEATDDPLKKSLFFHRTSDGALLGTWTLPRPQTSLENCTIHNFNVVPVLDRHVLVQGSYQSGTSVVDFTSPSAAREIAWTDPPPRPRPPGTPFCCDVGGVWSSYWYNDLIHETNINEGLNIWRLASPWTGSALNLRRLNPQTQEGTTECTGVLTSPRLVAGRRATMTARLRVRATGAVVGQPAQRVRVRARGAGVDRVARTNASGVATFTIVPRRAGTVRVTASALNMAACSATVRVRAAARPAVAPAPPALTGRVHGRFG